MKPKPPTKAQIRAELDRQMQSYLNKGGEVEAVPRGVSGHQDNTNPFSQSRVENEPRQTRTPVTDAVKALDKRKQGKGYSVKKSRGPRKKLIKDDFGEPLRWVWVDD